MGPQFMQLIGSMVLCMAKFSIGYRMIPEKATFIPQYQDTSVRDEYAPAYENTLPGMTSLSTPIAKSAPVTYASHVPTSKPSIERDIVQPMSSEEARAAYLDNQMEKCVWCATALKYLSNWRKNPMC